MDTREHRNVLEAALIDWRHTTNNQMCQAKRNYNEYCKCLESCLIGPPEIPNGASNHQLSVAANEFLGKFAPEGDVMRKYNSMVDRYKSPVLLEFEQCRTWYEVHCLKPVHVAKLSGEDYTRGVDAIEKFIASIREVEAALEKVEQAEQRVKEVHLQRSLRKIAENQDKDVKKWFEEVVVGAFREHISPSDTFSPEVQLEDIPRTHQKTHLPSEIVSQVYLFADVETCVTLRELGTQWYAVFQDLQVLLREKMAERSPWMTPGDADLRTWQDVALVFAKRMQSGKWEETTEIGTPEFEDDLKSAISGSRTKRRYVLAHRFTYFDKLPPSFSTMVRDEGCGALACEHVHYHGSEGRVLTLNPWTLVTKREPEEFETVSSDSVTTVIRFRGIEISLPSFVFRQRLLFLFHVEMGNTTVSFHIEGGGVLVMPRENPHFEHAVTFIAPRKDSLFGMGEKFVELRDDKELHIIDFASTETIKYTTTTCAKPVAFYNGLVWWHQADHRWIFPTFVDLQNPDKVYYRPDRTMSVGSWVKDRVAAQGSKARNASQFVLGRTMEEHEVVDLAKGVVTTVIGTGFGIHGGFFYLGFNNGKFEARVVSTADHVDNFDKIARAYGLVD